MIANLITLCRIPLSILLLCFPLFSPAFYVLYLASGITDMLDGPIARRMGTQSAFGAKLDSLADMIFVLCLAVKLLSALSLPKWLWIGIGLIALIKLTNLISGLVLYRHALFLHTLANKLTGLILFLAMPALRWLPLAWVGGTVALVAAFAAVQEGHYIRTGHVYPYL